MQELSDRSGTPVRTIRFYISQRLLPGPEGRGTATEYSQDHLRRLQLIRLLSDRHVPLNEIRDRLDHLPSEELSIVLEQEKRQEERTLEARDRTPREYLSTLLESAREERLGTAQAAPPSASGKDLWQRVRIAPGIEIHYTLEAERRDKDAVEALMTSARDALQAVKRRKGS